MAEKLAPPVTSNLTPNTFLGLYREIATAQREIEAATGRKRAILKRAKGAGVDLDALALMQRLANLEPEDAEMRLRNLVRYSHWADMQIGAQADLFGATDDQHPNDKARGEHLEFQADDAGYRAGYAGDAIDTNPHQAGTPVFDRWRQGWHNGQAALVAKMAAAGDDDEKPGAGEAKPKDDKPKIAKVQTGRRKTGAENRAGL